MYIKLRGIHSQLNFHFEKSFSNDEHRIALIMFCSTNFIPNVSAKNNKFYFKGNEYIIPPGQYELSALKSYFQKTHKLFLKEDLIKNRIIFDGDGVNQIDSSRNNNICELLGYPNSYPKLKPVDLINVHCSLANGQIISGESFYHKETDCISTFKINSGFKESIYYSEKTPIFFPVQHNNIQSFVVNITDQNDELINFGGAEITVILKLE